MALTSTRLTAEEYFALPPTEKHTQLIDGEIVVTEPTLRHQRLTLEIVRLLTNWLLKNPGPWGSGDPRRRPPGRLQRVRPRRVVGAEG